MTGVLSVLRAGVRRLASRLARDDRGQTLIEYVLLGLVVAVGIIATVVLFRQALGQKLQDITNALKP